MFRFICTILLVSIAANGQQLLYNGIRLPEVWPPRDVVLTNEPTPVPSYLLHPPAVIPIDVGRQLFVDDFLIEQTNLRREYHRPEMYSGNPVLKADRSWEDGRAMPYSGGAFYDPKDQLFKIWYESAGGMLYATSRDGVHWEKPDLDVMPGTNVVQAGVRESSTVWLDLDEKDPQRRYKMGRSQGDIKPVEYFVSADGIHWSGPIAKSVPTGDRTTFFKNPFRNVWVLSSRDHDYLPPWFSVTTGPAANWALRRQPPEQFKGFVGRNRRYLESPEFETMTSTDSPTLVSYARGEKKPTTPPPTAPLWAMADRLDPRRIDLNVQPQLYNLDAVAYESLMLGFFAIWPGQSPDIDK
ncbi:MAG TPA: hypothetical protein VMZ52_20370, partial [Bryobacteraceae bacterium]|nr:hypothetical protein [Bryobacteraceae bacterium]